MLSEMKLSYVMMCSVFPWESGKEHFFPTIQQEGFIQAGWIYLEHNLEHLPPGKRHISIIFLHLERYYYRVV